MTVSASRDRDARRTRDLLHKLGVPFSTETIAATARVRHGDRVMEWTGYQPHLIRRYCPLGGL